jgi:hypothetical protein
MMIPTLRRSLLVAFPTAFAALLAVSCGNGEASGVSMGNGTGTGDDGSGTPPDLNDPNGSGGGSNGGVTVITPGSECASSSGTADAIPAVVQMVVDISGSMSWAPGTMNPPRNGQQSKWAITRAALKDAVAKLPASIAVGVSFYPNNPDEDRECINNRVALPIALLGNANSMQRQSFNGAIDRARTNGGTPTHGAFKFGAETLAASTLAGKKFVLLITDGVPTFTLECEGDGETPVENGPLIEAVGAAFTGQQISTFVIGSPGSEPARGDLSQMASKGGTAKSGCSDAGPAYCHLDMTTAKDFAQALSDGLAEVAGQISTCEYSIPPNPKGQEINPKEVNVLYTHGDGTQSSIGKDAEGKCASGWQYDNDSSPSKITLCGTDCDAVKADQGAKIDVIFGCSTQVVVPVK